jgi:hypothetical protein
MNSEIANLAEADLPVTWYVHKHRREHEAATWDARRVQVEEVHESPLIAPGLLIKFALCVIALATSLGVVVTLIR